LAPSVSGSLLGYTWYLVVAALRDSSLWLSVVYGLRLSDLNEETTLLFLLLAVCHRFLYFSLLLSAIFVGE